MKHTKEKFTTPFNDEFVVDWRGYAKELEKQSTELLEALRKVANYSFLGESDVGSAIARQELKRLHYEA